MTELFYLFETYVSNIYKFGYTTKNIKDRIKSYHGVSKPKRIIGYFNIIDGILFECFWKSFLKRKNIKIDVRFGNEYFEYEGDINILYNEFYNMFKHSKKLDIQKQNTSSSSGKIDLNKIFKNVNRSKKDNLILQKILDEARKHKSEKKCIIKPKLFLNTNNMKDTIIKQNENKQVEGESNEVVECIA